MSRAPTNRRITAWQMAVLVPWTALVVVATALTWTTPTVSLTLGLLVCGVVGAEFMEVGAHGAALKISPTWCVFCLEMALLGPTIAALSAIPMCLIAPARLVNRWWQAAMFATLSLVGGCVFELANASTGGTQACSAASGSCASYLAWAFAICMVGLLVNFALVWAANFVPGVNSSHIPWRAFWSGLPPFSVSVILVLVVLAGWSRFGDISLIALAVLGYSFVAVLKRMLMAVKLADEVSEIAGKLDSERLYRVLANNLTDIAVVLLDADMCIQAVEGGAASPEFKAALTGKRLDQIEQLDAPALSKLTENYEAVLAGESREFDLQHGRRVLEVSVTPVEDAGTNVSGGLAVIRDVTAKRRSAEKVSRLARYDTLTGLSNRATFVEQLDAAALRAHDDPSVVLMLDLDGFKGVNDTLGHDAGDELLKIVAGRLQSAVRDGDLVARLAGDEFVVILSGPDPLSRLDAIARRIIDSVGQPAQLGTHQVNPSTSIGAAVLEGPDASVAQTMRGADIAMYQAKSSGGGGYRIFEQSMDSQERERERLSERLRLALGADELAVRYAPRRDAMADFRSVAAVPFWQHAEHGRVQGEALRELASQAGLLVAVGEWVLRAACRQAAGWCHAGTPSRVVVDVSCDQLRHSGLADLVARTLTETGLRAGLLELSCPEAALVDDGQFAMLGQLKALGVGLSIGDFASLTLTRLRQLPVDAVRLNRDLGAGLASGGDDAVRNALVALGAALDVSVIAGDPERPEPLVLGDDECVMVPCPEDAESLAGASAL